MNYEKGDRWGQGQERVMEQWCLSEYKTCMHENVIIHCFIQPTCTNKDTNLFHVVLRTLIHITLNVLLSSSNKSYHLFTLNTYQWQNEYFNFFFCYYDKSNLMEKVVFIIFFWLSVQGRNLPGSGWGPG